MAGRRRGRGSRYRGRRGRPARRRGRGDASAAPPQLSRTQELGSDLAEPGRALDCRGRPARAGSPGCTVIQTALADRTLVVPEDGAIRRWAVRSARGELGLVVVRRRGDDTFQIARSRNEFVGNGEAHVFRTDLAVERGDVVGLYVLPGSAAGLRPGVGGARTERWFPNVNTGKPVKRGFANELLLRVEYQRGGQQRAPRQVTGQAAERLEPGRVVERKRLRFNNGRRVEMALVSLGDRYALDQFLGRRRAARIEVPRDFRPGEGRILQFAVGPIPDQPATLGIFMEYARKDSARIVSHYYDAFPREFSFAN